MDRGSGGAIGDGDSELYGLGLVPGDGLWGVGDFEPNGTTQPLIEFHPIRTK